MSLIDDVKVALRVSSDVFDAEVEAYIDAAVRDLERVGVPRGMLMDGPTDPLVKVAIILYAKAHFGYDNAEASRFLSSYRQIVKDLLNSPTTYSEGGEDGALEHGGDSGGQSQPGPIPGWLMERR